MPSQVLSWIAVCALLAAPLAAQHRGGSHGGRSSHPRAYAAPRSYSAHPRSSSRESHRIHRSREAKDDFMRQSGHPHGWPGHVVDHIVPLACGGSDSPSNMQWQTVEEGKAKDKVERQGCSSSRRR